MKVFDAINHRSDIDKFWKLIYLNELEKNGEEIKKKNLQHNQKLTVSDFSRFSLK